MDKQSCEVLRSSDNQTIWRSEDFRNNSSISQRLKILPSHAQQFFATCCGLTRGFFESPRAHARHSRSLSRGEEREGEPNQIGGPCLSALSSAAAASLCLPAPPAAASSLSFSRCGPSLTPRRCSAAPRQVLPPLPLSRSRHPCRTLPTATKLRGKILTAEVERLRADKQHATRRPRGPHQLRGDGRMMDPQTCSPPAFKADTPSSCFLQALLSSPSSHRVPHLQQPWPVHEF
ncbi:hypothetical protein PAHAL_8G217800 [Panicum hallii]|uniref:Uncharacterized protein n=1 Tax=Panicum hallii TaxID=206008 RepID=A0A2T8I9U2_9POAL|nr:hypothetical protein PAHAL_8G217800 [Panicum hallii]